MATNEKANSKADPFPGKTQDGGRALTTKRAPALVIIALVSGLIVAEVLAAGVNEAQEFIFLGFFLPIAIGARRFSRKGAVVNASICTALYTVFYFPNWRAWPESSEELLVELAARTGLFMVAGLGLSYFRRGMDVEKEKALGAERERADRLKLMLEISTTVSSSLKIDQVLQLLAVRIVDTVGATFCRMSLLDTTGEQLRVVAAHPIREMELEPSIGTSMSVAELPEYKKAIETRSAVIVGGRRQDMLASMPHQADLMGNAKSLLLYPLVVGDRAVGIVCIGEHRSWERSSLSAEKAALCQTIVNQGAVAVGHALSHQALEDAFVGTIRSLAEAIDAKDPSTRGHSDWVSRYALMIGRQMGLDNGELDELVYAGYLHDVGKIGIPDNILRKTSQLSSEEWKLMKKHPIVSARILEPVPLSPVIKAAIRHHHERFDGKGYPYGLAGESIPLAARVLSVADSYEAMTSDRPYRKALSDEQAVAELMRCMGTQFDPGVVEAFLAALGRTPAVDFSDMGVTAEPFAS
ncbi:MAG: HD domain-containing phosphohydrolase [Thermoleophilia bacterium]